MKTFSRLLLYTILQLVFSANHSVAQKSIHAVIAGDFADPSIIRKGNVYYATGTSSEWAPHFPVYRSADGKTWKQTGYVFDKAPAWTSGSFWAPEYYFNNNTYFVYYTARRKKDSTSYIGVATSKYPDKNFIDHGVIIEHGKEAIDPFVFNDNGQLYITFKAYGLDRRPIEILASRLSADGLTLEGELFSLLKDNEGKGMEGQSILKKDDYYYLFYSGGNCCGINCSYNVRIARSKQFSGPYEEYEKNPALFENSDWTCSGHGTFVQSPDKKYYYLYHAYNKISTVYSGRQGLIAELVWPGKNSWPYFKDPVADKINADINDAFNTNTLAPHWQWDFRTTTPVAKQIRGSLHLTGNVSGNNKTGIVLTTRPASIGFSATTVVANHNKALKGLAYYGDASAATGIGVINAQVVLWLVKDGERKELAQKDISNTIPVELKISLMPDLTCHFFYKQGMQAWQELGANQKVAAGFLPQWDRSPRVGLHYQGPVNMEAVFHPSV